MRGAGVGEKQREHIPVQASRLQNSYRRNAQPFLEDFTSQAHGTRGCATHVGVVRTIGHVESGAAAGVAGNVHWHHHGEVREMRAAGVGIVEQRGVARSRVELPHRPLHRSRHRSEVRWHVIAHGDRLRLGVEDAAGVVAALLDVRRERGPPQNRSHLFGDRMEEVFQNFQLDGIEAGRFPFHLDGLACVSKRFS